MEASCWRTADGLRFCPPCILHTVAVMVMALAFHTKNSDGVEDALNIFLIPDLSTSAGSEAAILTWKRAAILGGGTLTFFTDTILLTRKEKVAQLEAWEVFYTVFLEMTAPTCRHTKYSS